MESDGDPKSLFMEIGTLIMETRLPPSTVKGRVQGAHSQCACTEPSCTCDDLTNQPQTTPATHRQLDLLWKNLIPLCIDILLYPMCRHGVTEAARGATSQASKGDEGFLLERWEVRFELKRFNKIRGGISGKEVLQTVRSYLHFSQLSAWLSRTSGQLPLISVYRVYAPGECINKSFSLEPEVHAFPVAEIRQQLCRISVSAYPRVASIPQLTCRTPNETAGEEPTNDDLRQNEAGGRKSTKRNRRASKHKRDDGADMSIGDAVSRLVDPPRCQGHDLTVSYCSVGAANSSGARPKVKPLPLSDAECRGQLKNSPTRTAKKRHALTQQSPKVLFTSTDNVACEFTRRRCLDFGAAESLVCRADDSSQQFTYDNAAINPPTSFKSQRALFGDTDVKEPAVRTDSDDPLPGGSASHEESRGNARNSISSTSARREGSISKLEHDKWNDSTKLSGFANREDTNLHRKYLENVLLNSKHSAVTSHDSNPSSFSHKAFTGNANLVVQCDSNITGISNNRGDVSDTRRTDESVLFMENYRVRDDHNANNGLGQLDWRYSNKSSLSNSTKSGHTEKNTGIFRYQNVRSNNLIMDNILYDLSILNLFVCGGTESSQLRSHSVSDRGRGRLESEYDIARKIPPTDVLLNMDMHEAVISRAKAVQIIPKLPSPNGSQERVDDSISKSVDHNNLHIKQNICNNDIINTTNGVYGSPHDCDNSAATNCDKHSTENLDIVDDKSHNDISGANPICERKSSTLYFTPSDCDFTRKHHNASKKVDTNGDFHRENADFHHARREHGKTQLQNGDRSTLFQIESYSTENLHARSDEARIDESSVFDSSCDAKTGYGNCEGEEVESEVVTAGPSLCNLSPQRPIKPATKRLSLPIIPSIASGRITTPTSPVKSCYIGDGSSVKRRSSKGKSSLEKQLLSKDFLNSLDKNERENEADEAEGGVAIPTEEEVVRFRSRMRKSHSAVFNTHTGLPTRSSPAPAKRRSGCFDYDNSLTSLHAIKNAVSCSRLVLMSEETGDKDDEYWKHQRTLSTSAPASTQCLLGNFEESMLNGRLEPIGVVQGFTAEIGASGSFCPKHVTLPVTAYFFSLSDDNAPSPYLGHVDLERVGKKGYHVPRVGTVQVTLFNPNGTVVKMFVVRYDLSDMPPVSQTFLRQRTLYMPVDQYCDDTLPSYLRYLIHLRFGSSKSNKIHLHTDLRLIFARGKFEFDPSVANYELHSFTEGPTNPKFSPKK